MNKKEKKARKLIKKIDKKRKKKERKRYEKDNGIPMYKPAGCSRCHRGQKYSGGRDEFSVTYYSRCTCANVKTKRYKQFLKDKNDMKVKKALKEELKFYDNNSHISVGSNAVDRSW